MASNEVAKNVKDMQSIIQTMDYKKKLEEHIALRHLCLDKNLREIFTKLLAHLRNRM